MKGMLIGLLLLPLISTNSFAQSNDAAAAAEQLRRIQQEQQQRQQEQFQEDVLRSKQSESIEIELPELSDVEQDVSCKDITAIELDGLQALKASQFERILDKYQGRCLGVVDIQNLMSEVTAQYILAGFVTARVYLSAQDLNSGVLTLTVVEGFLEEVRVDETVPGSISLFNVFPGALDEPLNLRDIEQSLENINRLQSNDAKMSIEPGEVAGSSQLVFTNVASKKWLVNASVDNYGSVSTGEEQIGVSVSLDSPFGWNDFVSATYRQTIPYDSEELGSRLISLSYSVPFGYSRLTLNASDSKYSSPLDLPSGGRLQSSGENANYTLRIDHLLFRNRDSRWEISGTLNNKETKSYIDDALIEVSSRKLTVFDVQTSYQFTLAGASIGTNAGYSRGLKILGALKDAGDLPNEFPKAQFSKWFFGANMFQSFFMGEQAFQFASNLTGQYSEDVLYGSEMQLIGGLYTVRGFSENSLSADHGFFWRNDLSMILPTSWFKQRSLLLKPYLGLDYGQVKGRNKSAQSGELAGAALGMSFTDKSINGDIFISHSIKKPSEFSGEGMLLACRLAYVF